MGILKTSLMTNVILSIVALWTQNQLWNDLRLDYSSEEAPYKNFNLNFISDQRFFQSP